MNIILLALLGASLRISIVAAVVAAALVTLRVRAAEVQHRAWTAVVAAMLTMPVLPYAVPALPVRAPALSRVSHIVGAPVEEVSILRLPTGESPGDSSAGLSRDALPAREGEPLGRTRVQTQRIARAGSAWQTIRGAADRWPLDFSTTIVVVYAAGVLILLCRMVAGWYFAARIVRRGHRVESDVVESPIIGAPVTVGVTAPTIVLPLAWRGWTAQTLRLVLAHERAHVARRDPLVHAASQLNRCLFWFHPLAWWLQRTLRATAEHASDAAAAGTADDRRRYAEVLIAMADEVRSHRGRVVWHGVGIDGHGLLSRRVERVLRGDPRAARSRPREIALAVTCAASIALAAACRQEPAPLPLIPQLDRSVADDAPALIAVARGLMSFPRTPTTDYDNLARQYLQRAIQLMPEYAPAHVVLVDLDARLRRARWAAAGLETHQLRHVPLDGRERAVAALPDSVRFDYLIDDLGFFGGVDDISRRWDDLATRQYVEKSMSLFRGFADDLLQLVTKFPARARSGTAIYRTHLVLGSIAWRNGDRPGALQHLRGAAEAPASEELTYGAGIVAWRLLPDLLDAGEREAVARFLDRVAAINVANRYELDRIAAVVRRGEKPVFPHWTSMIASRF